MDELTFRLVSYTHKVTFEAWQYGTLNIGVSVWASDQHLPHGFANVHEDDDLSDSDTLQLTNSSLWVDEDPGENMRCGLIWHGVRPLCEYIVERYALRTPNFIVELGAGMGIAGIVAAAVTRSHTFISDGHVAVVDVLSRNIQLNSPYLDTSKTTSRMVRWDTQDVDELLSSTRGEGFDLILAGDVIYDREAVLPLLSTIQKLLSNSCKAEFVMAHAERYPLLRSGEERPPCDPHLSFLLQQAPAFHLTFTELDFTPQCEAEKLARMFSFRRITKHTSKG